MSIMAMFLAIQIILVVTPLGYLPIGPISATTMHIPVIIAGIALGKKAGAQLGFVFGLTSVLNATFRPTLTSFCFSPFVTIGGIGGNCITRPGRGKNTHRKGYAGGCGGFLPCYGREKRGGKAGKRWGLFLGKGWGIRLCAGIPSAEKSGHRGSGRRLCRRRDQRSGRGPASLRGGEARQCDRCYPNHQ